MQGVHNVLQNNTVFYQSSKSSPVFIINGTVIRLQMKEPFRDSQLNELLYVIIVIMFYATALMTLIITQIKRQRREGQDVDYYDEYLQRNREVKRSSPTHPNVIRLQDLPKISAPIARPEVSTWTEEETQSLAASKRPLRREKSPALESIPDHEEPAEQYLSPDFGVA